MSRPPSSVSLLAAGALGAAAATLVAQGWKWYHSSPPSSCTFPFPAPSSPSHSGVRFEGSVSRIASDASYLEENEYQGENAAKWKEEEENHDISLTDHPDDPPIYLCPHCSNYINAHELIVPSEEDVQGEEAVQQAQTARILSAAEQVSIQLALKESLLQIFQSVDEDNDGIISREEMALFLKKLGLTGDREQAFLNIVGGDSLQNLPTPVQPESAPVRNVSSSPGEKRGSDSGTSSSPSGQVVGINFKQFLDRFQDTLEGMDAMEMQAATSVAEGGEEIATTQIQMDPEATFAAASNGSTSSSTAPSTSSPPLPSPSSSSLLTPPRGSRLTVNTITPAPGHRVTGSQGSVFTNASPASASSSSSLLSPSHSPSIRVFLGGACGETTWRKLEAIPQLQAAGISFYDPQVKEWSQKLVALEGLMKAWCKILFFVIGSKTRALASMIEVAALIAAGRRVILVIEPVEAGVEIEGQVPSASELKDLNRAREYLKDVASHYNVPIHTSADAGVKAIIAVEEEERKEARARLNALRESRNSVSLPINSSLSARRARGSILSSSPSFHPSPGHKKSAGSMQVGGAHPPPLAALQASHHAHSYSHSHHHTTSHHHHTLSSLAAASSSPPLVPSTANLTISSPASPPLQKGVSVPSTPTTATEAAQTSYTEKMGGGEVAASKGAGGGKKKGKQ
jgi:hypothetical protein